MTAPVPPTRHPFRVLGDDCQAADPPVQLSTPVRPCGRVDDLRIEVHYGVYYRICRLHHDHAAPVVEIPAGVL